MNKQKLLLLTFMQNDRGEKSGHGSDPVTGEGAATRTQGLALPTRPGPLQHTLPQPGASVHLLKRPRQDTLQSQAGAGSLTLLRSSTQPWGLGNGLMPLSVHTPGSFTWADRGHTNSVQKPS